MKKTDKILFTIFLLGLLIIGCIETYGFSIGKPFDHPIGWMTVKALWLWVAFWVIGYAIKFTWQQDQ